MRLFSFIYVFCFLTATWSNAASIDLQKIHRNSTQNREQIFITCANLPPFSLSQKGKRIDLIFEGTFTRDTKPSFSVDDRIVKFLSQKKNEKSILTFFLRYTPQQVTTKTLSKTTLVLDIVTGNDFTKEYPTLFSKLKGLELIEQEGTGFDNPAVASPYTDNWLHFFKTFESPFRTEVDIQLTVPPFPLLLLADNTISFPFLNDDLLSLVNAQNWEEAIAQIYSRATASTDIEEKKLMALLLGELLFRAQHYDEGFKQLYILKKNYKQETIQLTASYLIAHIHYAIGQHHMAAFEFSELDKYIDPALPFSPFILISQIESSLLTTPSDHTRALLARDDTPYPPLLQTIRELRQSDYLYTINDHVQSYVRYSLIKDQTLIKSHPFSLNAYCNTLYEQKRFKECSDCFQDLAAIVSKRDQLGPILFKKAMADIHFKDRESMYTTFSLLEDTYAETPAGIRADLKRTDIRYITDPDWRVLAAEQYARIAEKTEERDIAEEASLKEAVVYAQLGNTDKAITLVMAFLRNFRNGNLISTAQALLVEILPDTLKNYIDKGQYIKALALAKQNRELFQNNWIDLNLLAKLAESYYRLSIYDEALKLYLYLLHNTDKQQKEPYYLPVVSIFYHLGDYDLIDDYVDEYSYNYPHGKDSEAILGLHLRSLVASKHLEKAMELFPRIPPENLELHTFAATIYFDQKAYENVIEHLLPIYDTQKLTDRDLQYILAESCFKKGNGTTARAIFTDLMKDEKYQDPATYRIASIMRNEGKEEDAVKLLQEIVEKGTGSLWQQLATKDLEFIKLSTFSPK